MFFSPPLSVTAFMCQTHKPWNNFLLFALLEINYIKLNLDAHELKSWLYFTSSFALYF